MKHKRQTIPDLVSILPNDTLTQKLLEETAHNKVDLDKTEHNKDSLKHGAF